MFNFSRYKQEAAGLNRRFYQTNCFALDYSSASYTKSGVAVISVTVLRTFLEPATIRLTFTGGKEAGEDYGLGKNFDGSGTWENSAYATNYTTIAFALNELSKTVTITVVDNPTLELDRVMTLSLTNPSSGVFDGLTRTITIVDNNIPKTNYLGTDYLNIIDASNPNKKWGDAGVTARTGLTALVGDGVTDNNANWQAQLDWLNTNGGGILVLPDDSQYAENAGLTVYPNITICGQDANNRPTVLRKAPVGVGNFSIANSCGALVTKVGHGYTTGNFVWFEGISQAGWSDFSWRGVSESTRTVGGHEFVGGLPGFKIYKISDDSFVCRPYGAGTSRYELSVTGTAANPAQINLTGHQFKVGSAVFFQDIVAANWTALNGTADGHCYRVRTIAANSFTLEDGNGNPVNASTWGAMAAGKVSLALDGTGLNAWSDTTGVMKYATQIRTFATGTYSSASDSDIVGLINLILDGNNPNRGPWKNYEYAQSHLVHMTTNQNVTAGRLRFRGDNLDLLNCGGDAMSTHRGAHTDTYKAIMRDCFRGYTATGGYSKVYLTDAVIEAGVLGDPTGLDVEIDSTGFGATYQSHMYLRDVTVNGDVDLAFHESAANIFQAVNCVFNENSLSDIGFAFKNKIGTSVFTDCTIRNQYLGPGNRILYPGTLTFNNTLFIAVPVGTVGAYASAMPPIVWFTEGTVESITLNDCRFRSEGSFGAVPLWAVYFPDDNLNRNPAQAPTTKTLTLTNPVFESTLNGAVRFYKGAPITVFTGADFSHNGGNSCYGLRLHGTNTAASSDPYNWDITLDDCDFNGANFASIAHSDTLACSNNHLRMRNVVVNSGNVIHTGVSSHGIKLNTFQALGVNTILRTITGSGAPTSGATPGLYYDATHYDRYIDTADANKAYKCTRTGLPAGPQTATWAEE